MLKMIVADDEAMVREGIRNILDWSIYGIEIVGEATNGEEALKLSRKLQADILFTDVKMPIMDGLEAAQIIKEEQLDMKVIIFSGIQEFEYAKKAIKVNAEGYILKPLEKKELILAVKEVTRQIEIEKNRKEMMSKLKGQIKENRIAAEEKFLRNLLLEPLEEERKIADKLAYFNFPFSPDSRFLVGILAIDDCTDNEILREFERQLMVFSIKNVVEEVIRKTAKGVCVNISENEYALLVDCAEKEERTEEVFSHIAFELARLLGISVSMGISSLKYGLKDMSAAYKEARSALQFKFYIGKKSFIKFSDINDKKDGTLPFDLYRAESELTEIVKLGDIKQAEAMTGEIFAQLNKNQGKIEYVRNIGLEIAFTLSRVMNEFGKSMEDVTDDKLMILQKIQTFEDIFDLENYIKEIITSVADYFLKKFRAKNERLVVEIKDFISKEYMNNINVNSIAQNVFLSPNYISQIYKKETGETITDYLTRQRIDAAKKLLKETDLQIQQVSEMVGYEDASYFSKVFKKITGIYPQKYRIFLQ